MSDDQTLKHVSYDTEMDIVNVAFPSGCLEVVIAINLDRSETVCTRSVFLFLKTRKVHNSRFKK